MEYKQLKSSDVLSLRKELWEKNNHKCPICGREVDFKDTTLDHQHKQRKNDEIGIDGAGLVRDCICRGCNCAEGKLANALKRYLNITQTSDKIDWLKSIIMYYEKGTLPYIHPTEKIPQKIVSKRSYNKLKKLYDGKRKFPEYPKSGHLTKGLNDLFNKYNINPYN